MGLCPLLLAFSLGKFVSSSTHRHRHRRCHQRCCCRLCCCRPPLLPPLPTFLPLLHLVDCCVCVAAIVFVATATAKAATAVTIAVALVVIVVVGSGIRTQGQLSIRCRRFPSTVFRFLHRQSEVHAATARGCLTQGEMAPAACKLALPRSPSHGQCDCYFCVN